MDPIANLFTSLRNAGSVGKPSILLPFSKFKKAISDVLVKEGFISSVKEISKDDKKYLEISLKYKGNEPVFDKIKQISSPSVKIYVKSYQIPRPLDGLGVVLLSTPKGVMTGRDAKKHGLGGEVICEIY